MAIKGDWVQIEIVVLSSEQRASNIPNDTKSVPLMMWVKGHLLNDTANVGDLVTVETVTERKAKGKLIAVNPCYEHSFGQLVPELMQIDKQVKSIAFGGSDCER